jgi:hypothetical protein
MLSISISTRLRHQHESLRDLVAGLGEEQLKTAINPGKWTAYQQISHLAAYQPIFMDRLQCIRTEETPAFGRYVGDNDPVFLQMQQRTIEELLSLIEERGTLLAGELEGWSEGELRRRAVHAKYGSMDVAGWSEFYLLHEAHHLFAIFMLTQELRARG